MTINVSTNKTTVLGNGAQTQFSFGFIGVAAAYISVIFTDADGNETVLAQGAGASQYRIALNAPVAGSLWGAGGTVTYDPGNPIASGTSLTIFRTLPLVQAISLQNLVSLSTMGDGAETGLDTLEMQLQQIDESIGRSLVAPIVDPPTINLTLPAAAQRANTGIAFDSQGNVIAGTTPATGLISSVMQPVVDAASLALARTALGLGGLATEGIGAGLQDDGAGNARVNFATIADAASQTVTAAFHLTQRIATGPIVYTLPQADTLWNGFGFWVFAIVGNITITPNAADNFSGLAGGQAISVPQGSFAWISTNAAATGTWYVNYNNENISFAASVSANALTVTLNATALKFRDPTLTNGDPIWVNMPGGLSIIVPSGATLGTSSGVPFRLYLFAARNNGAPVLGVALATVATAGQIFPLTIWETQQNNGTLISAAADSAGTLYTSMAVTNDAVRMLGYIEFSAGQVTAGNWATAPSKLQVMGDGIKKPGDSIQRTTSGVIQPTSNENLVKVSIFGGMLTGIGGATMSVQALRNSTPIGEVGQLSCVSGSQSIGNFSTEIIDNPTTTLGVTYGFTATNGTVFNRSVILEELMG